MPTYNQSVPWKEHIFSLEALASSDKETSPILYVLYPESSEKPEGKWRIQCVPKAAEGFENRKSLPEACVSRSYRVEIGWLTFFDAQ
jgi:uncharacterized UPF0160 family protein